MSDYLLSMYQPDGPVPDPDVLDAIMEKVGAIKRDMVAGGAWVFSNGLFSASTATVLRPDGDEVLTTDGPYLEGKEHLGGITIVKAADLDEALEWGRRLAVATTLPVEVRPFAGDS